MPLRIGFDMDGVLADFASAYREVEVRVLGERRETKPDDPEKQEEAEEKLAAEREQNPRVMRRRRDSVWAAIEATPNFWTTLKPLDPEAVRRIHALMMKFRWEVFFITQRPATEGDTVQRQTQRWLVEQGFDLPTVLVIGGSRGAAAGALRLNYHVDDSPQNCLDIIAESKARPILIVPPEDEAMRSSARKLKIGASTTIGEALSILEQASVAKTQPGLLEKLATIVGWK